MKNKKSLKNVSRDLKNTRNTSILRKILFKDPGMLEFRMNSADSFTEILVKD